jgi:uncharacterized Zn-finger protein
MSVVTPSASTKSAFETITVDTATVACDGGNHAGLGHPRVFLTFDGNREIVCPYCSRTYVLAEGAKVGHGH